MCAHAHNMWYMMCGGGNKSVSIGERELFIFIIIGTYVLYTILYFMVKQRCLSKKL